MNRSDMARDGDGREADAYCVTSQRKFVRAIEGDRRHGELCC